MHKTMPELGLDEFAVLNFIEGEHDINIYAEPTIPRHEIICPECFSAFNHIHENKKRLVRDLNIREKRVGIYVQAKRYKCTEDGCGKIFTLKYDCIDPGMTMTKRFVKAVQEKALNHKFSYVAEMYGISPSQVEKLFSQYVEILNKRPDVKAPRVLGIDECHLQKMKRAVYVDIEAAKIVEMGESNKKDDVIRDLSKFVGLDKVEIVITDMYKGYRSAIQELMPNVIHIVDKFHVFMLFSKAVEDAAKIVLESIREDINNTEDPYEQELKRSQFTELNINVWMFRKAPENMNEKRHLQYTNALELYPDLAEIMELRNQFRDFYDKSNDYETARKMYKDWCSQIPKNKAQYKSIIRFTSVTMKDWEKEIFNYFRVDELKKTNATTERLNGAIKAMQNIGRGYSFRILRAKMLFGDEFSKKPRYGVEKLDLSTIGLPSGTKWIGMITSFDVSGKKILLENGGGCIDKIIDYYQKYGEIL